MIPGIRVFFLECQYFTHVEICETPTECGAENQVCERVTLHSKHSCPVENRDVEVIVVSQSCRSSACLQTPHLFVNLFTRRVWWVPTVTRNWFVYVRSFFGCSRSFPSRSGDFWSAHTGVCTTPRVLGQVFPDNVPRFPTSSPCWSPSVTGEDTFWKTTVVLRHDVRTSKPLTYRQRPYQWGLRS